MSKPRKINVRAAKGERLQIEVVGYGRKNVRPYLYVESSAATYGYIQDRDIKRLKKWCDAALGKK